MSNSAFTKPQIGNIRARNPFNFRFAARCNAPWPAVEEKKQQGAPVRQPPSERVPGGPVREVRDAECKFWHVDSIRGASPGRKALHRRFLKYLLL